MALEKLTDWTGKIIGWTDWQGSKKWLYDFNHRKLGYYDKATNKTYDWQNRIVGNGDIITTLLR